MGWHGDARDGLTFLMGTESRGAKELRYIGEDDTVTKALTLRGSMERWQKGVLHVPQWDPRGAGDALRSARRVVSAVHRLAQRVLH
jgi:hypothetical protein